MFDVGQRIGPYNLVKQIGSGGFGEVWLAERHTELLITMVAIKLPHRGQVDLEAIKQEASLWAKASGHPNVLPIIEANIYDGQVIIVSEYAPDGSLEDQLRKGPEQISVKQAIETAIGILSGLDFLHSRQIIHRDIKPANILLQGETPRLADFGISRVISSDTNSSTSIVGTPKYMAPEAFDGRRSVQTDIWSVGVILYQMLMGNVPFTQQQPTAIMHAILYTEPAPLPDSIPVNLRKIVEKSLAKLPENRFQTAREMREELQKSLLYISTPSLNKTEVLPKLGRDTEDDALTIDSAKIQNRSSYHEAPLQNPGSKPVANQQYKFQELPKTELSSFAELTEFPGANPLVKSDPRDLAAGRDVDRTSYQPVSKTDPSVREATEFIQSQNEEPEKATSWSKRRIVRWVFYCLTPLIGFLSLPIYRILIRLLETPVSKMIFGDAYYGWMPDVRSCIAILLNFILPGGIGALLGCFFPEGKWRWGALLSSVFLVMIIITLRSRYYAGGGVISPSYSGILEIIDFITMVLVPIITSYLGSKLGTRKSEDEKNN